MVKQTYIRNVFQECKMKSTLDNKGNKYMTVNIKTHL